MDAEKYKRTLGLMCPTCGCTEYSTVASDDTESQLLRCASCGREIPQDDLIQENSENINEHMEEIKKEVTKDVATELKRQLSSAFKNSKFIKVK